MKRNIIILIIAFLLFIPPTIKLWRVISVTENLDESTDSDSISEFMSNIEQHRGSNRVEHYSNNNFELHIPSGFMTADEANTYLEWLEDKYQNILDYMDCRRIIQKDNKKIEVFLLDSQGDSFCGGDYFVVYYNLDGKGVSVHEMTHSIDFKLARQAMLSIDAGYTYKNFLELLTDNNRKGLDDDFSLFFLEQRAVLIENEFGEVVGFPNFGLPINSMIYERLDNDEILDSFKELNRNELMQNDQYDISSLRYLLAGSFGNFLKRKYEFSHYNQVISKGYQGAFNKSLKELEEEWLSSLQRGYIIQTVLMVLAVIIILVIAHFWLTKKSKEFWFELPTIIMIALAFLSWGYYLSYSDNELWGVVLALIIGSLLKIWKTKVGIIALWIIGFLTAILPLAI